MPILLTTNRLVVDGVNWVDASHREVAEELATCAHGRVLEIGVGVGWTHAGLHANPRVTSIVMVDLYREVIENIDDGCAGIVTDWKQLDGGNFDCVILDTGEDDASTLRALFRLAPHAIYFSLESGVKEAWR